jgi:hypothetical protein
LMKYIKFIRNYRSKPLHWLDYPNSI